MGEIVINVLVHAGSGGGVAMCHGTQFKNHWSSVTRTSVHCFPEFIRTINYYLCEVCEESAGGVALSKSML